MVAGISISPKANSSVNCTSSASEVKCPVLLQFSKGLAENSGRGSQFIWLMLPQGLQRHRFCFQFLFLDLAANPLWSLVQKLLPTLVLSMALPMTKVALLVATAFLTALTTASQISSRLSDRRHPRLQCLCRVGTILWF